MTEKNEQALTVARLQRFYGGDPMAWFHPMQQKRLQGFIDAMPVIMAEERLAYIMDTAVGSGAAQKGAGPRHIRTLERDARKGESRRAGAGAMGLIQLQAMGVEVA